MGPGGVARRRARGADRSRARALGAGRGAARCPPRLRVPAPDPVAPLALAIEPTRPGRRVQELAVELRADCELVCRASALRVQPVPDGLPAAGAAAEAPMPPPDEGDPVRFALDSSTRRASPRARWRCASSTGRARAGPARAARRASGCGCASRCCPGSRPRRSRGSPRRRTSATACPRRCRSSASCSSTRTSTSTCTASRAGSGSASTPAPCSRPAGRPRRKRAARPRGPRRAGVSEPRRRRALSAPEF